MRARAAGAALGGFTLGLKASFDAAAEGLYQAHPLLLPAIVEHALWRGQDHAGAL